MFGFSLRFMRPFSGHTHSNRRYRFFCDAVEHKTAFRGKWQTGKQAIWIHEFMVLFSILALLVPFTFPSEAFVYICIVHTPFLVARFKFIFWYFSLIGDYATEHSTYACYFRHAHKLWQNPETDATL